MNNNNYDSSSVTDKDLPALEDYEIISGDDLGDNNFKNIEDSSLERGTDIHPKNVSQSKSWIDLYIEEWNQLFCKDLNIDELKKMALDGELCSNRFRSICWRCMLGILHNEPKQWLMELNTYRSHYGDLWVELQKNPWNVAKSPFDNPLSQEEESIWQKYFNNEELKFLIHQDVVRTFPNVNFFREETIQDTMVRILFCYARQNPALSYRQGMHEILAPLIFVLHCDYQALSHAKDQNLENSVLFQILDPRYVEEDAYCIFKHIMSHIECSYRIKNMIPTSTGYFTSQVDDENYENEVISRLRYIKENILETSDPDLNKHLDTLDIPLHLFEFSDNLEEEFFTLIIIAVVNLILQELFLEPLTPWYEKRWLRLLFGREFPFQDLLILWDAIFSISNFELVNYIVVSMLTAIRPLILAGDYTTCLTNLMHYPSGVDVMFVIQYALYLMSPTLYPAPAVTSFLNKLVTLIPKPNGKGKTAQTWECDTKPLPKTERLKNVTAKQTKWLSGKSHSLVLAGSGDGDGNIIEGYALDDPKILRSELETLGTTIGLTHAKLCQYYDVLRNNLTEPVNVNVNSALDGINELCKLLKAYDNYSNIEPASEAGETKQITSPSKKNISRKTKSVNAMEMKANTLPKSGKKLPPGELKVFKECQGGQIVGAPMPDPLRLMKKISAQAEHDRDEINVEKNGLLKRAHLVLRLEQPPSELGFCKFSSVFHSNV